MCFSTPNLLITCLCCYNYKQSNQCSLKQLYQQTSPELFTIRSTQCNNIVHFDNMVNHIVTIRFAILSISTILLPYMITIWLYNIVKIANIVTVLQNILTIWWHDIDIIYDNNVIKLENMMNNIVNILFTILSNLATVLAMLLQYCYFGTILWIIL